MRELPLGNEAAPRWEPRPNPALPLGLNGSRPARPHSHGFREALWIWPLQRCQLQGLHPSWDQEPNLGIFSWRRSLLLPGRTQLLFIPAWSNPTFLSLAQGSRSDFAKFASSVCEFSDKFWVRFLGFFSPLDLWRAQQENGGGGQERGGAEREALEPGILTWTRLMALVGAAHRAPYVSRIKAGSEVCANSTGISRSPG